MSARSILVDGTTAGRPEGYVRGLVVCDGGRRALFTVGAGDQTTRAWAVSLDDGAIEGLAEGVRWAQVRFGHRAMRLMVVEENSPALVWRDLAGGGDGVVGIPTGSTLVSCSPDGRFAGLQESYERGSQTTSVWVVRVADERVLALRSSYAAPAFSDDGRYSVLLTDDGALIGVPLDDGSPFAIAPGSRCAGVRTLHTERGGTRVLMSSWSRELLVFDLATRERSGSVRIGREAQVHDFAAGRVLLRERGDGGVAMTVRDLATGDVWALPGDANAPAALTPDGRAVLRYSAPVLELVDVETGAARRWHDGHDVSVANLTWSSDGKMLATLAQSGVARVWYVPERSMAWELESARGSAAALAFSPDRRLLYALGPRGLVAWEMSSGLEVMRDTRAGQRVLALALSPDGRRLAALGPGMPGRVIDLGEGARRVATLDVQPGALGVAFVGADRVRCVSVPGRAFVVSRWFGRAGELIATRTRDFGERAVVLAVDDAEAALVVLRGGAVTLADLRNEGEEIALGAYPDVTRLVCARSGVVVLEEVRRGDGLITSKGLVAVDLGGGGERARVALSRVLQGAAVSPDGAMLAVSYVDGGVEVFELRDDS